MIVAHPLGFAAITFVAGFFIGGNLVALALCALAGLRASDLYQSAPGSFDPNSGGSL